MVTHTHKWHLMVLLLGGVMLGAVVTGCVTQDPFLPQARDEIPDGPGLFTGSKGAWVISRQVGAKQAQTEAAGPGVDNPAVTPAMPQTEPSVTPSAPEVTPSTPDTPKRKTPPM